MLTAIITAKFGMWTDKKIKALKPRKAQYKQSDGIAQRGTGRLVFDVRPTGLKTAYYQYFHKGKREYIKIGIYKNNPTSPGYTLHQINKEVERLADIHIKHGDVKAYIRSIDTEKERERKIAESVKRPLKDVLEDYLNEKHLKPGTIQDYRKAINEVFSDYIELPITDINRDIILTLYKKRVKKSPARANNSMRVFRALYNYHRAVTRLDDGTHLLPENPVSILSDTKIMRKSKRRNTYIATDQIKSWFEAVNSLEDTNYDSASVVRDYFIFILLTGVRREEARTLLSKDVDLDRGLFILRDTKNNEIVELPMSDYVLEIARRRKKDKAKYLFKGEKKRTPLVSFKRPHEHVKKKVGFHFTPHDLRRTFITIGESLDISIYTVKRLVNHKLQESADVTAGYVVRDVERMRAATQRITDHILSLADLR